MSRLGQIGMVLLDIQMNI